MSPQLSLLADLALAEKAAREAGEILRGEFGKPHHVEFKTPDQPVTEADIQANRRLKEILTEARPEYSWISEESIPEAANGSRFWVVDPLDGTWNFIEARPEFAVCVGLQEGGNPLLGVVYNPMTDTVYSAAQGHGATRNGVAISARPVGTAPTIVASRGELSRGRLTGIEKIGSVETLGSTALKMARVAEGGADLYISRTLKGLWDICAPSVIVREAGGSVHQLDGSAALYDSGRVRGIVAVGADGSERLGGWLEQMSFLQQNGRDK